MRILAHAPHTSPPSCLTQPAVDVHGVLYAVVELVGALVHTLPQASRLEQP